MQTRECSSPASATVLLTRHAKKLLLSLEMRAASLKCICKSASRGTTRLHTLVDFWMHALSPSVASLRAILTISLDCCFTVTFHPFLSPVPISASEIVPLNSSPFLSLSEPSLSNSPIYASLTLIIACRACVDNAHGSQSYRMDDPVSPQIPSKTAPWS